MPQSWDMGQILSLLLRRKACEGFVRCPKNLTTSVGFEPANSGTRGQHANHLTTESVHLLPYTLLALLIRKAMMRMFYMDFTLSSPLFTGFSFYKSCFHIQCRSTEQSWSNAHQHPLNTNTSVSAGPSARQRQLRERHKIIQICPRP